MHRFLLLLPLALALVVVPIGSPASPQTAGVFRGDEVVASFTSRYEPGQPRVTNIRRAAQLLDGTVIAPGARFSMNAVLGKRTRARGFVPAPMISGGRLVPSVGGGISQVATALYNAAFFSGLRLVAHTPHSFYISRYPMGREATISWGGPELVFENDWSAPVTVRLAATSTSVTVRMYSEREGRRIESWTGRPHSHVRPTTRVVHNPGLPLGSRRVVQEAGASGFTIEYGRRVLQHGSVVRSDRFRVRYDAVDRIIEVGTR
ncbi:MAG TPA: VanW family protein [Gaiellaceae bacterium]|nr:VanW family protein [Gaiellaceae bacterium]